MEPEPCGVAQCPALAELGRLYCPAHRTGRPMPFGSICGKCNKTIEGYSQEGPGELCTSHVDPRGVRVYRHYPECPAKRKAAVKRATVAPTYELLQIIDGADVCPVCGGRADHPGGSSKCKRIAAQRA